MARLIDADAFFDNLDSYSDRNKLQKMLDKQPTAYDVEKVVEEIDDFDDGACGCMRRCETEECLLEAIKRVVRKGGVNEK